MLQENRKHYNTSEKLHRRWRAVLSLAPLTKLRRIIEGERELVVAEELMEGPGVHRNHQVI